MPCGDHIVYVVDDDPGIREAVDELLGLCGFRVSTFASAAEYVEAPKPDVPACLVLDVQLPDINGLELQEQLAAEEHPPIVFFTAHGDIPLSVRAMKAGAFDFLAKPFREEDLVATVESALDHHRAAREVAVTMAGVRARYDSLTARERDVLALVVSGLLNKQAAARLGISVVTLQIHRGNVMRKMAARSLAELVRMAMVLEIPIEEAASPRSVPRTGSEKAPTELPFSTRDSAPAPGWRRAAPGHRKAS